MHANGFGILSFLLKERIDLFGRGRGGFGFFFGPINQGVGRLASFERLGPQLLCFFYSLQDVVLISYVREKLVELGLDLLLPGDTALQDGDGVARDHRHVVGPNATYREGAVGPEVNANDTWSEETVISTSSRTIRSVQ